MLTNLVTNLDKIIEEIETKVTPSNIREGIELFGIEGSLPQMITQNKHIVPSLYTKIIVPDIDYNGLHEVVVDAVTSAIDKNIKPGNIKHGTKILHVLGQLSEMSKEEYDQALLLEMEILGYTLYVVNSSLILTGEEYKVEDNVFIVDGTVEGTTLKIN